MPGARCCRLPAGALPRRPYARSRMAMASAYSLGEHSVRAARRAPTRSCAAMAARLKRAPAGTALPSSAIMVAMAPLP